MGEDADQDRRNRRGVAGSSVTTRDIEEGLSLGQGALEATTGVVERYVCGAESQIDLAFAAARLARKSGVGRSSTWLANRDQTGLNTKWRERPRTASRSSRELSSVVSCTARPRFWASRMKACLFCTFANCSIPGANNWCRHLPAAPGQREIKDFLAGRNDRGLCLRPAPAPRPPRIGIRLEARRR